MDEIDVTYSPHIMRRINLLIAAEYAENRTLIRRTTRLFTPLNEASGVARIAVIVTESSPPLAGTWSEKHDDRSIVRY